MAGCREHLISWRDGADLVWGPVQCKRWSCENCAPWNADKLSKRIAAGKPDKMLTLTYRATREGTPHDHACELVWAWRVVLKRFKREFPRKQIEYACVVERTANGEPHLHLALRADFIPFAWLQAQMKDLIDSPRVRIERLRSVDQAIDYLTGYMTKDPYKFEGCKRFWFSRGYDLEANDDTSKKDDKAKHFERWEHTSIAAIARAARALGAELVREGKQTIRLRGCTTDDIRAYLDRPIWLLGQEGFTFGAASKAFVGVNSRAPPI
jgi:hypothetical protein